MMLPIILADYAYVTDPLNEMLTRHADVFVSIGDTVLQSVTGLIMILFLAVYGLSWVGLMRFIFRYFVRLSLCNVFLYYYDRPMSFLQGYKLHQIPSEVCDTLVSYLDLRRLDIMLAFFKDYLASLNAHNTDWALRPLLWIGEACVVLYEGLLWAAIPVSYDAVAVLTLLLPLLTFTIMIPGLSHMFSNCFGAIWQAAFYRVTAAALVFCAATSVLAFLAHELHGDYSVEEFVAVYPKMVGLMFSWLLAFLVVGHLTSDFFKGSSSAGNGFGGFIARLF